MNSITSDILSRWQFLHYANTPETVLMREIYSGMYVSWDWEDYKFRIMPDYKNGFRGIILPWTTMNQIFVMVAAMGCDWSLI